MKSRRMVCVVTVSRRDASRRSYALAFALVLSPAVMQMGTCDYGTGDPTLSRLEVEVLGENRIAAFDAEQQIYSISLPLSADTAVVRAYSTDPGSTVSYNLATNNHAGTIDTHDYGHFPTGGGEIELNGPIPEGRSILGIHVRAPGGARAVYAVEIAKPAHPNQLGPYKIGYTTFVAQDPARVIDPGAPLPPRWVLGEDGNWPLYIRVMYPASVEESGPALMYSQDNPLYPGSSTTGSSYPSTYGALADVPVASPPAGSSGFPMVVYSHGRTLNGVVLLEDAHEILASHGFVVVLIDHTADVLRATRPSDPTLGSDLGCLFFSGSIHVACRTPDVPFAIDMMLARNADPNDLFYLSIDPDAIGLEGYSFGFGTALATMVGVDELGLVSAGIIPDDRVKAMFLADGRFNGVTEESLSGIDVPLFAFMGRHPERLAVATSLLANAGTQPADKMGSWIDATHAAVGGDACTWRERVLDAVEVGTATSWDTYETQTYIGEGVFEHCPASTFEGHTPEDIALLGYDPSAIPADMPTGIPQSELYRLKIFYLVAFFETYLAGKSYYAQFLTEEYAQQNEPLIHFGVGEFPSWP